MFIRFAPRLLRQGKEWNDVTLQNKIYTTPSWDNSAVLLEDVASKSIDKAVISYAPEIVLMVFVRHSNVYLKTSQPTSEQIERIYLDSLI